MGSGWEDSLSLKRTCTWHTNVVPVKKKAVFTELQNAAVLNNQILKTKYIAEEFPAARIEGAQINCKETNEQPRLYHATAP